MNHRLIKDESTFFDCYTHEMRQRCLIGYKTIKGLKAP